MKIIEELEEIAYKARSWRLAGDHHYGRQKEFPLIGMCFDNAYVVYHLLENNGYSPLFVEGTTKRVADSLIQNGVDIADLDSVEELAGHVHYWVRVERHGKTYEVDIASDTEAYLGQVLVAEDPSEYYTYTDSVQRGEEMVASVRNRGDRCRYCGGHRYDRGGCPRCVDELCPTLQ